MNKSRSRGKIERNMEVWKDNIPLDSKLIIELLLDLRDLLTEEHK